VRQAVDERHGRGYSILFGLQGIASERDRGIADLNAIVDRFEAVVRDQPARRLIALPAAGRIITAEDIWRRHLEYRRQFSRLPLDAGDLLVCGTGNHPDLIPALLACRALGVTMMAVDIGTTDAEVAALCGRYGARALLTAAPPPDRAAGTSEPGPGLTLARCPGDPATYPGTAMLKLTSGSSGPARATRTTEAQLIADGEQIAATMQIGRDDTQMAAIPLAHSYGLGVIVMPMLLQGTPLVLRESFVPHQLPDDARRFEARRLPGVPFMFEYLIDHMKPGDWPSSLTQVMSAGARLSPDTLRAFHARFGVKIHSFYGTTETGGISYDARTEIEDDTTLGLPLSGVSLSLRSTAGLPDDCQRVHVRSAAVSSGYVGSDTGDFVDGGFLTADCGMLGQDGRLTLTGRVSSFINVAGRKVQPDEIEAVLRSMPGIADVRVVGAADARRGQMVVACLVPQPGSPAPTTVAVRQFCSTRLAAHKIPRTTIVVEAIPLNPRGKTDRPALAAIVERHVAGRT
jgi:long-chain acyl-CoA synthetase